MKRFYPYFTALIILASCNNNIKQSYDYENPNANIVSNEVSAELANPETEEIKIPTGFSHGTVEEYSPQSIIEGNMISDLKEMEIATNNLDYEKVTELYYPDYFKYLQKLVPDKKLSEIKTLFRDALKTKLPEKNKQFFDIMPNTKYVGITVTDIKNRVKENNKLLYLYEFHTFICTDNDTIIRNDPEYAIAASLDNGHKWYSTGNSIEENFELLSISFSNNSIEKALTIEE